MTHKIAECTVNKLLMMGRGTVETCRVSCQNTFVRLMHLVGFIIKKFVTSGPGSVVGIATAYGLDGPGIESRWCEIFRTSPHRP